MSSPIHHAKNCDAELIYAPPWAREQGAREQEVREPLRPSVALARGRQRRKPVALSAYAYSGDRDMAKLQRQLALDPEGIPEPPVQTVQSLMPMVGRLCGVGCVAASIAWVFISYPGVRFVRSDAARAAAAAAQPEIATPKSDPLRTEAGAGLLLAHGLTVAAPVQPPADTQQTDTAPSPSSSPTPSPQHHTVQTISVTAVPPDAAQPNKAVPIDGDELAMLLKRGKQALTDGDLAAARLLLRRVADGGSAEAAFALGTTFDPVALRKLHAIGAEADVARAREWYEKAAQLGSSAATEKLANAVQ